ncbi:cytochrome c [Sediminibacterium roseum]|uniref:Cytochrome c n=1 Tax=Sediminibacterium roseum TaxID=1978412 RepID=A0ABW9ZXB5_9BACT|nr:cytochrome c [Sediminibacterium roseum]NCI51812.1 cytochrome c [Sediminibacterium roseum]
MKKLSIITVLSATALIVGCSDVKRTPGHVYMPDMANSRAYETYADHSNLAEKGINYNNRPVNGTLARGEEMPFHIAKDSVGSTRNYEASKAVVNPIDSLSKDDLAEAERLYLINCGICHGKNLDGNGPLYNDGKGPYPAAPKNLKGDAVVSVMPEGQMFYSVTYGKGSMGSYASQLDRKQRWMVIKYVKMQQNGAKKPAATPATTNPAAAGSPAVAK